MEVPFAVWRGPRNEANGDSSARVDGRREA